MRKLKLIKIEDDNKKYSINNDLNDIKIDDNIEIKFFASLVKEVLSEIEIYNNETEDISYDKYIDIIHKLPFLGDLIRSTCSFINTSVDQTKFIKMLENVNIEIQYKQISYNFLFMKDFDRNDYINTNDSLFYNMNNTITSGENVAQLLYNIHDFINKENIKEKHHIIDIFNNIGLLNILIKNNIGYEDRIRLFDPLYANHFIRKSKANKRIHIIIKAESNNDASIIDNNDIIELKKGFAKFDNVDGLTYSWSECKIKEGLFSNGSRMKDVIFSCFSNKFYFKIDKDNIILQEVNKTD